MDKTDQQSQYTGITEYYDRLMKSGYYDHAGMANVVKSIIGANRKILELGVGTGLFAAALLDTDPSYEITGVDITPSMLALARDRLGEHATLIEGDVIHMQLDQKFDVAVSSGGVWVIIEDGNGFSLGTHDIDLAHETQRLKNVARHLRPGGQLLLSVQEPHKDQRRPLPGGIVYTQKVRTIDETPEYSCMEKHYSFRDNGRILAEETLHLGFYKKGVVAALMAECGFRLREKRESRFYVYSKM
ncbi:MAG: class I SAM-dependent methyltransferase [Candidatus Krumholzibacteriia bacterium]